MNISKLITLTLIASTPLWAVTNTIAEDVIGGTLANDLEEASWQAAYSTYNRLVLEEGCIDGAQREPIDIPTDLPINEPTDFPIDEPANEPNFASKLGFAQPRACTGQVLEVFNNVREVVHTANDIVGIGPTEFSLGSDLKGLGFALRWLAAEEFAAQDDMSADFVNGQISGLSSRLSALRFGAQGFQFANNGAWKPGDNTEELGDIGGAAGGNNNYSRWGGFLNIQGGYGSREGTSLEDAFDIQGGTVTLGLDYRASDEWITGMLLGYSEQEIDFDSSQSIVEGGIESSGYNIMPFFMYQPGAFYLSGSLGIQQLTFDSIRAIRYTSFNPSVASSNTETISTTDANIASLFAEVGYSYNVRKLTIEPYLSVQASETTIDEFTEDDINDDAFDLIVREQNNRQTDVTVGLKTQYTFTPKIGVFIPYVAVEYVSQNSSGADSIKADYASLASSGSAFIIPTEELDSSYQTYTFGISSVLRGGRELTPGGGVGGDVQAFANIKTISGLEGYELTFYTLGLRYAF